MLGVWLAMVCALAAPLTLDDVRAAVDARVPALAAAEAQLSEAEAELLAARGAFDPELAATAAAYAGKDARTQLDGALRVATPLGPSLEAGWLRGSGDFPTYADRPTADRGEVRLGLEVPLLDGLGMGEDRAKLLQSRMGVTRGEALQGDITLRVRRKAERAWWEWVASGARLAVAERQLELAEERDAALRIEVREGSRAPIAQLDNERALFGRRADQAKAEQDLAISALVLSLWVRDASGEPVVPTVEQLPELPTADLRTRQLDPDLQAALQRPDLQALRAELAQQQVAVARGRNRVLPKLDGRLEARQDLTDEPTEWIAGASMEVPVLLRVGRGTRDAAAAKRAQTEQELRAAQDQVKVDVSASHLARDAAAEVADWSSQAADRAEQVLALERRAWELGASDLFVLLSRERQVATAQRNAIDATLDLAKADLALRATVGDL